MTFMPQPKPRPALLDRQAKRKQIQAEDEAENKIVRERSGGQCEVREAMYVVTSDVADGTEVRYRRCERRASQIHHMIGGWGKRARGISKLAEHKQHVCAECHREITGHVLRGIGGVTPHYTDCYERVR